MKAESHSDRLGAAKAWLVTGPLGRALAFTLDFAAALRAIARSR
ncbi:MAG TPA: hypothetical protein VGO66_07530 [Solirubrobacterales bacterium]|jgi:hypothetical protein|nr:hypothetical protein [Solirubrobacterales bacterium]